MNVLVTGATGFIGAEIVLELSRNNFNVTSLAGHKTKPKMQSSGASKIFRADISRFENLQELCELEDIDAVVHTAGLAHQFGDTKKEAFDAVNVLGAKNVAQMAVSLGAKQFILIGSTAVYAPLAKAVAKNHKRYTPITEESKLQPPTLYAESKLRAEQICVEICEKNKIPLTVLRLAPVIGEANVGNVRRLIEAIERGRFVWVGKGENYKSLIYKNDVARACIEVLRKKTGNTEIFNLAAKPMLLKEFVEEIAARLNKKIPKLYVPENLLRPVFRLNSKIFKIGRIQRLSNTVEKWLADDVYSAEKIKARYGFEPQTSIAEAIRRQIESFQNRKS